MFLNTIDKKPDINLNGVLIKDLIVPIFSNKSVMENGEMIYSAYKIPEKCACRPDLISIYYYGTEIYAELVLKFNGISNPFTLKPGRVILLPRKEDINRFLSENLISSYGDEKGPFPEDANLSGPSKIKEKIRAAYKYIKPKNIKEILSTDNSKFKKLRIPDGSMPSYISVDEAAHIVQDGTGRFKLSGKPNRYTPPNVPRIIRENIEEANKNNCINPEGEELATLLMGPDKI